MPREFWHRSTGASDYISSWDIRATTSFFMLYRRNVIYTRVVHAIYALWVRRRFAQLP